MFVVASGGQYGRSGGSERGQGQGAVTGLPLRPLAHRRPMASTAWPAWPSAGGPPWHRWHRGAPGGRGRRAGMPSRPSCRAGRGRATQGHGSGAARAWSGRAGRGGRCGLRGDTLMSAPGQSGGFDGSSRVARPARPPNDHQRGCGAWWRMAAPCLPSGSARPSRGRKGCAMVQATLAGLVAGRPRGPAGGLAPPRPAPGVAASLARNYLDLRRAGGTRLCSAGPEQIQTPVRKAARPAPLRRRPRHYALRVRGPDPVSVG